jgi:hypothetical protein
MTLLLNYRPVLRQPTGIGVYAQGVLPALQQLPHVLIPGGDTGSGSERLRRLVWTQRQLPRLACQHRIVHQQNRVFGDDAHEHDQPDHGRHGQSAPGNQQQDKSTANAQRQGRQDS